MKRLLGYNDMGIYCGVVIVTILELSRCGTSYGSPGLKSRYDSRSAMDSEVLGQTNRGNIK